MLIKEISSTGASCQRTQRGRRKPVSTIKCRSKDVSTLSRWLNDGQYLSHEVINEIIEIMAHKVIRQILSEIRDSE